MRDEIPAPTEKYKKHSVGWLAPDGKYYPCEGEASHYPLAISLLEKFFPRVCKAALKSRHAIMDDELQRRGWIRVGAMLSYNWGFIIWKKPTQKQVDVIWDYCRANKSHMPNLEVED